MRHRRQDEHTSLVDGNWWLIRFNAAPRAQNADGLCYHEARVIDVSDRLTGDDAMSACIHEHLHAVYPFLCEDAVLAGEKAVMEAVRVSKERARKPKSQQA